MKNLLTTLSLLCFFLVVTKVSSQTLNKPELSFTYACAKKTYNDFKAIISFKDSAFEGDNIFYVELSDPNGSFDSPTVLSAIANENSSFEFETKFEFPKTIEGEAYKIRVRTTNPVKISPSTAAFNAFYLPNVNLVLNNYKDVALCSTTSVNIALNVDVATEYLWYKNGELYKKTGASLEVNSSGEYYAEPFYGDCTGALFSNIVVVTLGDSFTGDILGDDTIEVCPNTSHTFNATVADDAYSYTWYKNNVKIEGLAVYSPALTVDASSATYGDYKLIISNGKCEVSSKIVTLTSPSVLELEALSDTKNILIEGSPLTIALSSNTSNVAVTWYKNDTVISKGKNLSLEVEMVGTYYALVSVVGSCAEVVKSPTFQVLVPENFIATITYQNSYEECTSSETSLAIAKFVAFAADGFEQELALDVIQNFNFSWKKNNEEAAKAVKNININSYASNGIYFLEGDYQGKKILSNRLIVSLGISTPELLTSKTIACTNGQIELSTTIVTDAIYSWYKDDSLLGESLEPNFTASGFGKYTLVVDLNGCTKTSEITNVIPVDEDSIEIYPSADIVISTNTTQLISATGATTYKWTDAEGNIVSESDSFVVDIPGKYYLNATIDGCVIVKEITASENNVVYVPNIISPNNDNINDKWILPAKFVNDPEIEVTIFDASGNKILNTKKYQNNWPLDNSNTSVTKSAVYYYLINKEGKAVKKGSITVIGA